MSNNVTVQDLIDEFVQLDSGEGWVFARLVACSCEKKDPAFRGNRYTTSSALGTEGTKISVTAFAERSGKSFERIRSLLAAWDLAHDMGLCPPSSDLVPSDSATTMEPPAGRWEEILTLSNKKLREAGQGAAEDAAALIRLKAEQEDARVKAEQEAAMERREAALHRQIELAKVQHAVDLEAEKIKADKIAAQRADIAARNARATAEAVAKENARREHRAAETRKQEAVLRAAALERAKVLDEQKAAMKAAQVEAERVAAEERAAAAEKLASMSDAEIKAYNVLVRQMLDLHAQVANSGLSMADAEMGRYLSQHEKIVGRQGVRLVA